MRILFLTQRLPYEPNRGDRIRAFYLLRELARFARVAVVSLIQDPNEAAHQDRLPFAEAVVGVPVSRGANYVRGAIGLAGRQPLTHLLLHSPQLRPRVQQVCHEFQPNIVLAYCSGLAHLCLQPPLDRLPFVVDMVDVDSEKWSDLSFKRSPPISWLYRREGLTLRTFERRLAHAARANLVVNARERDLLRGIAPRARVEVIENGVDLGAFQPDNTCEPAPEPTVVFSGVMDYYPNEEGVEWFAKTVWPAVRRAVPQARFTIVGANPSRSIRRLAERDRSIVVTGRVATVQPHLWSAWVAVAPLRAARGVQNKVLEALAAGLPVVTTPEVWAGLPPEATPGCLLAKDGTDFARMVCSVLERPMSERRRLAAEAQLGALAWSTRLAPVEAILSQASHPVTV